jgi:hypothetical protein
MTLHMFRAFPRFTITVRLAATGRPDRAAVVIHEGMKKFWLKRLLFFAFAGKPEA